MEENDENNKDFCAVTIDKNSDKYKTALKFVNGILTNIGKSTINDLTEFKDIDRMDIITNENTKLLSEMEKEIWEHYDKKKCGGYHISENRVFNILRGIVRDNNLKISFIKKDITEKSGIKKGYRKAHLLYHIY